MSHVEVRDHALWAKHIYGNEPLKEKILNLSQGQLIELVVDGWRGRTTARMGDQHPASKLWEMLGNTGML